MDVRKYKSRLSVGVFALDKPNGENMSERRHAMIRNRTKLPLLFASLSLLLLTGCTPETSVSGSTPSSPSGESSSQPEELDFRLTIQSPLSKTTYYQYERFETAGLLVSADTYDAKGELTSSQEIEDYELYFVETGESLTDDTVLNQTGTHQVEVRKEGYESAFFDIDVRSIMLFHQYLEIASYPDRRTYKPGETFSDSGFTLLMHTTFYDSVGRQMTRTDVVTDYILEIDGQDARVYTFSEESDPRLKVNIFVFGDDGKELTDYFPVYTQTHSIAPGSVDAEEETFVETDDSLTIHITNPDRDSNVDPLGLNDSSKGYYSPDQIETAYTAYDLGERGYLDWKYAPSSSDDGVCETPLLVIPVVVPGYESKADKETMDMIQTAFFGSSEDLHFESLRSYYYKSSRGQLDITGTVTDYYFAGDQSQYFYDYNSLTSSTVPYLAIEAAEWVKETYGTDLTEYDSDGDGLVDAVWLVWVGFGYDNSGMTVYWPFSSTTGAVSDPDYYDKPVVNNFGWAGADFIRQYSTENYGCDAHVLIHETGHMLGLTDYYSYGNGLTEERYGPLGGVDMMDNNVGDHNPYSKMLLGWTSPYIVYGNDVTITIPASVKEDAVILLPYEGKTYTVGEDGKVAFNPYDEYLILDFYSSEGKLNGEDYDAYDIESVKGKGGRLYHVDARLARIEEHQEGSLFTYTATVYDDPDDAWNESERGKILNAISNTHEGQRSESELFSMDPEADYYDEIRWISADKRFIDSNPDGQNRPDAESLFREGDAFLLDEYADQFNGGGFNCDKPFAYGFEIVSINA